MIEEVMRLPASSFFFGKVCQLNLFLRKMENSEYFLNEDIGMSYQAEDIERFESDLKEWYRKFQSEIELKVPFIIVDTNERQSYYQELHKTLDRCLTSYEKIIEFLEFIRSKPNEKRTKQLCMNYVDEKHILKSSDAGVVIEDLKSRMFILINDDYDNADLRDILAKLNLHLNILSIASGLLAEKISFNQAPGSHLKWMANVPALGYIFNELAINKYFLMPSRQSKDNYREMGRIVCRFFGIEENDYHLKQFTKSNALSPKNKGKFTFPHATDLQ